MKTINQLKKTVEVKWWLFKTSFFLVPVSGSPVRLILPLKSSPVQITFLIPLYPEMDVDRDWQPVNWSTFPDMQVSAARAFHQEGCLDGWSFPTLCFQLQGGIQVSFLNLLVPSTLLPDPSNTSLVTDHQDCNWHNCKCAFLTFLCSAKEQVSISYGPLGNSSSMKNTSEVSIS